MQKLIVPIIFLAAQLGITAYGYYTGSFGTKGSLFGYQYDSLFISSFITQIKFIWVLILINMAFTIGFNWGLDGYKNFIVVISLWIACGPIAAFIFNLLVPKEPVDLALVVGIVLITIGALMVTAHKEVMAFFS